MHFGLGHVYGVCWFSGVFFKTVCFLHAIFTVIFHLDFSIELENKQEKQVQNKKHHQKHI